MRRKKNLPMAQGTSNDVPWALFPCFPLLGSVAVLSFCSSTRSHPASSCSQWWSWVPRWWLSSSSPRRCHPRPLAGVVPVPWLVSSPSPGWCCPRSLAVVVPVPSPLSCPFPHRRPAPLFSSHNPPREQLLTAVVGGAVVVVVVVVVVPVAVLVSSPFSPPCPVV